MKQTASATYITSLCMLQVDPKTGAVMLLKILEVNVSPNYL